MAKADIQTPNGTKILVEGSSEEIKEILLALHTNTGPSLIPSKQKREKTGLGVDEQKNRVSVRSRIESLKEKGFFASPHTISEVKQGLESEGHIYPTTHLSGPLQRLTQLGTLRRLKNDKGDWQYTNP